jgi:sortase A
MRIPGILNGIQTVLIAIVLCNIWLLPPERHSLIRNAVTSTEKESPLPHPLRLRMPARDIDAMVEPVGLTREGKMGIPDSAFTVGWYEHGAVPGARGNAVLAGHRDTQLGTPGIFWTLSDVQLGEMIEVETEGGTLQFRVIKTEEYPFDKAPLEEIFGFADGHFLNLITCAGDWQRSTYDKRLVIFTELHKTEEKTLSVL